MGKFVKKNKLIVIIGLFYCILLVLNRGTAITAFGNSAYYLIEMAQILPVIFMLTVAIDVLIPKEWIVKRLGSKSGTAGMALALAFGSLSAGPIYAAFPIAKTLHKKGASVANVVVILSAWAVIKVPMLANEAKFLGPDFMAVRWLLTVLFIFVMGTIMGKMHIALPIETDIEKTLVSIKSDYCIGCTACEKLMPEMFEMREGKALVIVTESDLKIEKENLKNRLYQTASKCPTKAIEINLD